MAGAKEEKLPVSGGLRSDQVSGVVLVVLALVIIWFNREFPVGTLADPGPGYVPLLLACTMAGIGLLAIPGLGAVIAAGWLAATAVRAAAGAATGGIVGALVSAGIDREHAEVYSESIRRGSTLVIARVLDEEAAGTERILGSYRPVDPAARGADYRKEGWMKFDPKAPAYQPNQAEIDRMRGDWPAT